ncbi:MAG: serine hydrolase [bacterium]|nr:serine hydrolase [bacterium]
MRSTLLATMLEQIGGDNPGIRSVTVIRHGTVVLDARISPLAPGDRHDIHSCTKSVLSALVGIAIDNGDLPGVDTRVLDFFPGHEFAHLDRDKDAMTLGHLLTMSAGLDTEDSYLYNWSGLAKMRASDDWAQYILDLPVVAEPGTRFEYSNGVSELIAIILRKATGQSADSYAREHLFEPLGIVDFGWEGSRADGSLGYSGLSLHPLDMARLGYLYLRKGEWDGTQVVTADWVRESTSPRIAAGTMADSYGYQWWVGDDMFSMQGYGGQFVYVLPAQDLVVVFTGALSLQRYFEPSSMLNDYITSAVTAEHALPANPVAAARLDSLVRVLGTEKEESPRPAPPTAYAVSGKNFEFAQNRMGLRRLALHFTEGSSAAELEFVVGGIAAQLTIGLNGVRRDSELFGQRWACRGNWLDGETFVLEQEAPGKALRRRATLSFQGDTLTFEIRDEITGSVEIYTADMVTTSTVDD